MVIMIKKMVTAMLTATEVTARSEFDLIVITIKEDSANNNNKAMASEIQTATEVAVSANTI